MIKNNALIDLYVVGKEVKIADAGDNEVTVWLQKINPAEHEQIYRRANAARTKTMVSLTDKEGEGYQSVYGFVLDMDKDEMVDLIANDEIREQIDVVESEISERDEWNEDGYLQGLRDEWEATGREEFFSDERTPESEKIFNEIKRFTEQVADEVEARRQSLIADHLQRDLENVIEDAVKIKLKQQANIDWLKVFRKGKLVFAVRDAENHAQRLLDWDSLEMLQEETYTRLLDEYEPLEVPPVEGKE